MAELLPVSVSAAKVKGNKPAHRGQTGEEQQQSSGAAWGWVCSEDVLKQSLKLFSFQPSRTVYMLLAPPCLTRAFQKDGQVES